MNCQKAGDLLSAYIDDELTGRQGTGLETHLAACAGCQQELATLRTAIALLEAPKTMAKPEGLLEEFKAKYLPEAEAAPAPRWSFRLPALPQWEWPSLGRVLVPMGGIAAAAAALLVVLSGQPTGPQIAVGPSADVRTEGRVDRVASLPMNQTVDEATARVAKEAVAVPAAPAARAAAPAPTSGRIAQRPSRQNERVLVQSSPTRERRQRRRTTVLAKAPRPESRKVARRIGTLVAKQAVPLAPVTDSELRRALLRHEEAKHSEESLWGDQVVIFQRKAAAAVVEDSFASVSCTDLKTGKVTSVVIGGAPAAPAAEAPAPVEATPAPSE